MTQIYQLKVKTNVKRKVSKISRVISEIEPKLDLLNECSLMHNHRQYITTCGAKFIVSYHGYFAVATIPIQLCCQEYGDDCKLSDTVA